MEDAELSAGNLGHGSLGTWGNMHCHHFTILEGCTPAAACVIQPGMCIWSLEALLKSLLHGHLRSCNALHLSMACVQAPLLLFTAAQAARAARRRQLLAQNTIGVDAALGGRRSYRRQALEADARPHGNAIEYGSSSGDDAGIHPKARHRKQQRGKVQAAGLSAAAPAAEEQVSAAHHPEQSGCHDMLSSMPAERCCHAFKLACVRAA